MSETRWGPEPWRMDPGWGEGGSCARDEVYGYLIDSGDLSTVGAACEVADARRIVACVNACAGIPTEALESGALGEALGALHEAVSYADIVAPMLAKSCPGHADALKKRLSDAAAALRRLGRLP